MARPYAQTPAAQRSPPPAPAYSPWAIVLPAFGVLVVVSIVVVFVVLPIVLRSRCIAMAADRGVALSVDHVDIGYGDVRLVKVAFALDGVPQLKGRADDAQVTLSGLTPSTAAVHGLSVAIDGPVEEVQKAFDGWRAARGASSSAGGGGAGGGEQKVVFAQGHLTWTRVFGQSAKIDAPDTGGEIDAGKDALKITADHLSLTAGDTTLGPWRTTLERDADGTRTTIELDPVVHGGPTVLYVRSAAGAVSINAKIPESPLSRIGLPPKALRIGSDANVEAQLAFEETLAGAATLKTSIALSHAIFSGVPIDADLQLRAAGSVANGLDVKDGTLKAGPLTASVAGTVKLFDDGLRLSLSWTARPVSCVDLGKQMATQALGGLGAQLGALAQEVGGVVGLRVTGNAAASGLVTLDSRDVSATSFTMTSNETCGVAFF
ncbi:MAG: hypothetical protein ACLQVI_21970 [Polyangiaceae bacterium]